MEGIHTIHDKVEVSEWYTIKEEKGSLFCKVNEKYDGTPNSVLMKDMFGNMVFEPVVFYEDYEVSVVNACNYCSNDSAEDNARKIICNQCENHEHFQP